MKNELAALCAAGLALVSIPPINGKPTKAPINKGWNQARSASNPSGYSNNAADFANCTGFNIGLYHGASNTLALDLDDVELARKVFEDVTDTQLLDWLENESRIEIKSPKANRGKLLFKLPAGFNAGLKQLKHEGKVIFELRCGNCQDVVLGNHPEGGEYQLIGNPAAIPAAPPVLLDMLSHWDAWKPCFDSALGIEQAQPKIAPRKPQQGVNLKGYRCPIQEFNQSFSVAAVLIRTGYKQAGKDRFIRPGSESKAPGAAIMRNCADGIERVFSHGGDALNDGFAHDAFDCMRLLEYGDDWPKALDWNEDITRHNQRLYMLEQAKKTQQPAPPEFTFVDGEGWTKGAVEPFSLGKFSLNGQVAEMRKKMLEDKFVLGQMAIYGQATVFYAPPNAGKTLLTLKLLIDGIESGDITGKDVFYVNADDNYKGLVNKLELAEKHGFHMLSPGHNNFESKKFLEYLRQMVKDDNAKGKIIILDTLKKFSELMDKKAASDFMKVGREFIATGGTLILLAHTNKKRDAEGKVVFGGTSDIVDDVDCAYMLDALKVGTFDTTKTVLFENIKSRGDVVRNVGYTYALQPKDYSTLIKSVKPIVEEEAAAAKLRDNFNYQLEKDAPVIDAVIEAIEQGITLKTEMIDYVHSTVGSSKKAINTVLTTYDGTSRHKHRWQSFRGDKNAKVYALLNSTETSAEDYRRVKNGEY